MVDKPHSLFNIPDLTGTLSLINVTTGSGFTIIIKNC